MFAVKFGNGNAIEVRDVVNRLTLYHHVALAMNVSVSLPPPEFSNAGAFVDYVDQVWHSLAGATEHQFVFVCSDVEPFAQHIVDKFEAKCAETFGKHHDSITPTDERSVLRAGLSEDGKLRPRCWLLDTANGCIYCLKFEFASPIYQLSVFTGIVEKTVDGGFNFVIRKVVNWCGAAPESLQFARQQLNFWFNTPPTEQCWFRPNVKDCVNFIVDIEDALTGVAPKLPMLSATADGALNRWSERARIESSK